MKGTEWAAKPYGITNNYTTHQTTKIKYFLGNTKESRIASQKYTQHFTGIKSVNYEQVGNRVLIVR
jgi:hypothetical protein